MSTAETEQLLDVLVEVWSQAVDKRRALPTPIAREAHVSPDWWDGMIAGLAIGIAGVSGLGPGTITGGQAIAAGCDIARARLRT